MNFTFSSQLLGIQSRQRCLLFNFALLHVMPPQSIILKEAYSYMTPSENKLIVKSFLHSRRISIHLEGPVGKKVMFKDTWINLLLINPVQYSQGPLSRYILILLISTHLHPATDHAVSQMSLPVVFFTTMLIWRFLLFSYDIRPQTNLRNIN